jgi:hypothetical protein
VPNDSSFPTSFAISISGRMPELEYTMVTPDKPIRVRTPRGPIRKARRVLASRGPSPTLEWATEPRRSVEGVEPV